MKKTIKCAERTKGLSKRGRGVPGYECEFSEIAEVDGAILKFTRCETLPFVPFIGLSVELGKLKQSYVITDMCYVNRANMFRISLGHTIYANEVWTSSILISDRKSDGWTVDTGEED